MKKRAKTKTILFSSVLASLFLFCIVTSTTAYAKGGECTGPKVDCICQCTNDCPCSDDHGCCSKGGDDQDHDVFDYIELVCAIIGIFLWLT